MVCLRTRSGKGSENVATFASIVETAKLRGYSLLENLEALLTEPRKQPMRSSSRRRRETDEIG